VEGWSNEREKSNGPVQIKKQKFGGQKYFGESGLLAGGLRTYVGTPRLAHSRRGVQGYWTLDSKAQYWDMNSTKKSPKGRRLVKQAPWRKEEERAGIYRKRKTRGANLWGKEKENTGGTAGEPRKKRGIT